MGGERAGMKTLPETGLGGQLLKSSLGGAAGGVGPGRWGVRRKKAATLWDSRGDGEFPQWGWSRVWERNGDS